MDESAVERELARAIYVREPDTENMVCPPEWTEAFEAADQLRELFAAVPEEVLKRWLIERHRAERREEEVGQETENEVEGYGITTALLWRAISPNADEILDEEQQRRLRQTLAGFYYGERGYEMQKRIDRLMEERNLDA